MLDLCYVHATSDSIRWRALLESVESRIIYFFFWGGGRWDNNPKTSLILWVEVKTLSPLTRHSKVVGRWGSCSSRSRFMKNKIYLVKLTERNKLKCMCLCFLLRPVAKHNSIYIFSHVLLAVWVWSLKSNTIFMLMHENLNFPNTWEKLDVLRNKLMNRWTAIWEAEEVTCPPFPCLNQNKAPVMAVRRFEANEKCQSCLCS